MGCTSLSAQRPLPSRYDRAQGSRPGGGSVGPTPSLSWMSDAPSGSALHPVLHTRFCDLVGCCYPIVQTGMGWVSGASLTAATSCAGGFGILAAVTMTGDQMAAAIRHVRDHTDRGFGVNLRADQPDLADRIAACV